MSVAAAFQRWAAHTKWLGKHRVKKVEKVETSDHTVAVQRLQRVQRQLARLSPWPSRPLCPILRHAYRLFALYLLCGA